MSTATVAVPTEEMDDFVGFGDFTEERHETPEPSEDEADADILRYQAKHPERLTVKPVKWAD
jgi:hypothetical protein